MNGTPITNNTVAVAPTGTGSAASTGNNNASPPPLTINHTLPYDMDDVNGHYSPTLSHIGVAAVGASPLIPLSRLRQPSNTSGATNSMTGGSGNNAPSPVPKSKKDKSQDPDNPTPIFHLPTALLNEGSMASGRARRGNKDNNSGNNNSGKSSPSTTSSSSPNHSPNASPVMTSSSGSLHSLRARSITSLTLPAPIVSSTSSQAITTSVSLSVISTRTSPGSVSINEGSSTPPRSNSPPAPPVILDSMTMLRLADENGINSLLPHSIK
jgi:hypothetical protein